MNCDACGKSMTDENGISLVGVKIAAYKTDLIDEPGEVVLLKTSAEEGMQFTGQQMTLEVKITPPTKEFIQKQLGEYSINRSYRICWECWLKSLGVKPKVTL